MSVDHTPQRATSLITQLDLTSPEDLHYLLDFIKAEAHNIFAIHLAPPCGTSSQARNKPIPGCPPELTPQVLRDAQHPMGVPSLAGLDKVKVENCLYFATENHFFAVHQFGNCTKHRKPTQVTFLENRAKQHPGFWVTFDHCMMGGNRDKTKSWWSSQNIFSSLGIRCSRDHEHKSWTPVFDKQSKRFSFPPAEETAYTGTLCSRIADIYKRMLLSLGYTPIVDMQQQFRTKRDTATNSVWMGFCPVERN